MGPAEKATVWCANPNSRRELWICYLFYPTCCYKRKASFTPYFKEIMNNEDQKKREKKKECNMNQCAARLQSRKRGSHNGFIFIVTLPCLRYTPCRCRTAISGPARRVALHKFCRVGATEITRHPDRPRQVNAEKDLSTSPFFFFYYLFMGAQPIDVEHRGGLVARRFTVQTTAGPSSPTVNR
eukprot:gene5382-3875_t